MSYAYNVYYVKSPISILTQVQACALSGPRGDLTAKSVGGLPDNVRTTAYGSD